MQRYNIVLPCAVIAKRAPLASAGHVSPDEGIGSKADYLCHVELFTRDTWCGLTCAIAIHRDLLKSNDAN
jgi:hypothetical protein